MTELKYNKKVNICVPLSDKKFERDAKIFEEIVAWLLTKLPLSVYSNKLRSDSINVVVGWQFLNPLKELPRQTIIYQLEQLGPGSECIFSNPSKETIENIFKKASEIWDYSDANRRFYKKNKLKYRVVRPGYCTFNDNFEVAFRPEYDIGFCGCPSKRRIKLLEDFDKAGYKVSIIEGFGEERDQKIANCKAMVNIHYAQPSATLEKVRLSYLLNNGVFVLSETPNMLGDLEEYGNWVKFTDYNGLVELAQDWLHKDPIRRKFAADAKKDFMEVTSLYDVSVEDTRALL